MNKNIIYLLLIFFLWNCKQAKEEKALTENLINLPELTFKEGNRLASLPLECMQVEYPNKLNQSLNDSTHIETPKELHPAFYGCYDWHSSVHGHWSLVSLLKQFPTLHEAASIRQKLIINISQEHILQEVAYFKMEGNSTFERTYGWAWILKLAEELHIWDDPLARDLERNLQPLTHYLIEAYINFLPKLNYPIRVGEHSNTAFGLRLALDYAETLGHIELQQAIKSNAVRFYASDVNCPLDWEPSGFDFLSPCLEEANLMRSLYSPNEFKIWFDTFLPELSDPEYSLKPEEVSDRTDGKLVHLDGLNFSRAWCLYGIAKAIPEYPHLNRIASEHIEYSLPNIVDGNYSGTHWLGSFALNALNHTK
jgi:hypothetical protein